jgi:hypothetical protein
MQGARGEGVSRQPSSVSQLFGRFGRYVKFPQSRPWSHPSNHSRVASELNGHLFDAAVLQGGLVGVHPGPHRLAHCGAGGGGEGGQRQQQGRQQAVRRVAPAACPVQARPAGLPPVDCCRRLSLAAASGHRRRAAVAQDSCGGTGLLLPVHTFKGDAPVQFNIAGADGRHPAGRWAKQADGAKNGKGRVKAATTVKAK